MSNNTLRARLAFSFKGETHDLEAVFDLDTLAAAEGEEPNFHHLLAQANGIDPYSYLYEVLESYDIDFSEPTGIAADCLHDGRFDWPAFAQRRREEHEMGIIQAIAERLMGVADLEGQPDLKAALLAAYRAGKAESK
ncbi:MAG: hypothetical protein AB7U30_02240 [Sulfuricellaceae bacterium]|jgi:hypothetical protein